MRPVKRFQQQAVCLLLAFLCCYSASKAQSAKSLSEIPFHNFRLYHYYLNPAMPGQYGGLEAFTAWQGHAKPGWQPVYTGLLGVNKSFAPMGYGKVYGNVGGMGYFDREGPHISNIKGKFYGSVHIPIGNWWYLAAGGGVTYLSFSTNDPNFLGRSAANRGGIDVGGVLYRQASKAFSSQSSYTNDLFLLGISATQLFSLKAGGDGYLTTNETLSYNMVWQAVCRGIIGYNSGSNSILFRYQSSARWEEGMDVSLRGGFDVILFQRASIGAIGYWYQEQKVGGIGLSLGYDPLLYEGKRISFLATAHLKSHKSALNPMDIELSIRYLMIGKKKNNRKVSSDGLPQN